MTSCIQLFPDENHCVSCLAEAEYDDWNMLPHGVLDGDEEIECCCDHVDELKTMVKAYHNIDPTELGDLAMGM